MDLEQAAERLYGLVPDEFVAERTALAAQAREAGDASAAAAIRRLTKPSQPAWQVNLLVREHPEALEELAEVGRGLRDAAQGGDPAAVRRANSERQRVVSSLADRAGALAQDAGRPTTAAVRREVEATLQAALTSPDAADQVASGRLTASLFDSGLDALGLLTLAPAPPRASRSAAAPAPQGRQSAAETSQASSEAAARGAAREAVQAAQGALREAKADAARTRSIADQLGEEVAQLTARLAAVRRRADAAVADADQARAREEQASAQHEQARAAYDALGPDAG